MEESNIQFVIDENGYKHYLEEVLGGGGQGVTWKTKDPNILIKMKVNPSTGEPVVDDDEYEKFKRELDEVRILDIPADIHIAKPVSLLQKPYCGYTMRLLNDMKPIKHWIRPFDGTTKPGLFLYNTGGLRHRYELLMNTAEIFTRLYAHSTVYADISPENIFASGNLESSEVWLIDADNMRYRFDVGKQIQTPGYGAPEIMKGELNSLQADEYSFAILAHEILTMNSPFNGELLTDGDGGGWDDEEVDYADLASKGEVAWIYDENDDSNRCHTGLGPKFAFTKNIKKLFEGNFGEKGRHDPLSRPKMRDWYIALRQAANLTAKCKYCGSTFLVQLEDIQNCKCPFCKTGRESARAPFIAAIVMDYFNVDKIVADVNEDIDAFNSYGGYEVEPVSLNLLKRKEAVSIKIIDNMDGDYFLYNYHTSDTSFSEKVEKSIEIEISKGEYTIRNLMNRSIRIGTPNSDYGEIMPKSSKRLSDINNIILTMSVLRGDMTDYLGDEEFTTDDIIHLRERRIQFALI